MKGSLHVNTQSSRIKICIAITSPGPVQTYLAASWPDDGFGCLGSGPELCLLFQAQGRWWHWPVLFVVECWLLTVGPNRTAQGS